MAVELATAYVSLVPSAKGIQSKIAKELDIDQPAEKSGRSAGSRLGEALGKTLKRSVIGVGAAAGGVLATALFKGWQRLTAIEDAQAKLAGLGHSAQSVKTIMDNALAAVKGTAFGLDEAATVAASAVAAGIKPGRELQRTLSLVGDTASIAGTSMRDMGAIFNKVAAANRLTMAEVNQLSDRGVPILQMLADQFGVTAAEASKMVSQGKVDFAAFRDAIEANVAGAALASGDTTRGAFANMGAAMSRFGASLLSGLFPIAKRVFNLVTAFFDEMTEKARPFAEQFGAWIEGRIVPAAEKLLASVGDLGAKISEFFDSSTGQELKTSTFEKLESIFGKLSTAARDLAPAVATIAVSLGTATGAIGISTWELLLSTLDVLASVLNTTLVPVLETLADWMDDHQGAVTAVVAAYTGWKVGKVATDIGKTTIELAKNTKAWAANAIAMAKAAPAKISDAWDTLRLRAMFAGDAIRKAGTRIAAASRAAAAGAVNLGKLSAGYLRAGIEATKSAARQMAVATAQRAQAAAQAVAAAATKVWTGIQAAFNAVMAANPIALVTIAIAALVAGIIVAYKQSETFRKIVDGAFRAVGAAGKWMWENAIRPAWAALQAAFQAVANVITWWWRNVVTPAFNTVASLARWLWERVQQYFGFWRGVFNNIRTWVGNAVNWVRDRFNWLVGFVRDLPGRIRSAAAGMWDGIKNAFRSAINWLISRWNNLSLTLPSVNIPGIGRIGGFTLRTVKIPYLAEGGIVPATPGGRLVMVAEAGQAEAVIPLDRLEQMIGPANRPQVIQTFHVQNVDERAVAEMVARRLAMVDVH